MGPPTYEPLYVRSDGTLSAFAGNAAVLRAMGAWAKDNLRVRVWSPQGSPGDKTIELQVRTAIHGSQGVWETVSEASL